MQKGIMVKVVLTAFLIVLISSSAGQTNDYKNINYINLKPLSERYELKHERDQVTGREIFSGNGTKLIICAGMMTMMINDQLIILEGIAKTINGEIAVPADDLPKIEVKIKENRAKHIKKEYGIKKIVIDPGHGGPFSGAQGTNGILEKDINLSIALKLKRLLEKNQIKVVMTRETDVSLSQNRDDDLDKRVAVSNIEQPDLFVSIHCNWVDKATVRGFEIYHCPKKPLPFLKIDTNGSANSQEVSKIDASTKKILSYALREEYLHQSLDISREVQKAFSKLPTNNRGIRGADFIVIKKTDCPAILVEVDYISNKTMCKELSDECYQNKIAQQLAEGIISYQEKVVTTEGFVK